MDVAQLISLVASPSLGAVTYQALSLREQLRRINDQEYLPEANRLRELFECITEHVLGELWRMHSQDNLFEARDDPSFSRMQALARILHDLHSFLRYLWASSPRQSPPGIQSALNLLTELFFPNPNPVCLVRPQWKYNLTYISMTGLLKDKILIPSVLDPDSTLGSSDPDEMLQEMWERYRAKESQRDTLSPIPPQKVAILSFAGLDTDDTLQYPLLAHELGHFIDLSLPTPMSNSPRVTKAARLREEEVRQVLESFLGPNVMSRDVTIYHNVLVQRVYVALREIVADLLATRMMGFAFFATHSEFLKTLAPWPQPILTNSGYPGIKYRLRLVLKHLVDPEGCNFRAFLQEHSSDAEPEARVIAAGLNDYLDAWEQRVAPAGGTPAVTTNPVTEALNQLAIQAVERAHVEIVALVKEVIPQGSCCRIGPTFFKRILFLEQHLAPSCPQETSGSFAEIAAAAWAYQIIFGEEREHAQGELPEKALEYRRICQLVLKAVELIPTGGGDTIPEPSPNSTNGFLERPGALSGPDIVGRLQLPLRHKQRLSVIPFSQKAVNAASLDIHLGNWFVVSRRTRLGSVNLGKVGESILKSIGREDVFVSKGHDFIIHPGDLLLGVTLEFIALPSDTIAFVEGKSSLGRMGLLVATATTISPGFHGVVVLELANAGTVPLKLEPGMAVGQLVLQVTTSPVPDELLYRSRYYCQIKP